MATDSETPQAPDTFRVSRRSFIQTLGVSPAAGAIQAKAAGLVVERPVEGPAILGPDPITIELKINGKPTSMKIDPATTLLEAIRMHAGLTGCKEVCDRGSCGGCSMIIDGKLTVSCMMLAVDAIGSEI